MNYTCPAAIIPAPPFRHSRESGNPVNRPIPATAGIHQSLSNTVIAGRGNVMLKLKHLVALLLLTAVLAPAPALAQDACASALTWTGIVPDCIAPGTNYRILFVTRRGRDGRPTNIAEYNTFVQNEANRANGNPFSGLIFKVLGSTEAVDARDNTDTNRFDNDGNGEPVFYYKGRRAANNYADLYDGSWDTIESRDENGAIFDGVDVAAAVVRDGVFTGSLGNGTEAFFCINGSSCAFGRPNVGLGLPTSSGEQLHQFAARSGRSARSFYALSEVIRRPVASGVNICGRTPQVRDAILAASIDTFCTSVSDLATMTTLDLDNMGITALANGDFAGLTGLTHLLLINNGGLTTLPANIFAGLTTVESLFLNSNNFASLPVGIFDGLTALEELNLSNNNNLDTLPTNVFAGLSALEELNLSNNNLDTLPTNVFAGLTTVESLFLNSNNFASLPVGTFDGLTALEELNLSNNNNLDTLPTNVFAGLSALEELNLSNNNNLDTLPTNVFAGLSALEELNLSNNNNLDTLPTNVFAGLSALVELNLFNSNLDTLPTNVFAGLTTVESLFLNSNNFASLPVGIFDGLDALANLALASNPFTAGGLPAGIFDDVLDTVLTTANSGSVGLSVDARGRAAHFVCSHPDVDVLVAITSGVSSCLRITTAQLNIAIALIDDTVVNICSRSPEVQTALLDSVGGGITCRTITVQILASIESLILEVSSPRIGDFDGLAGLRDLRLFINRLTTLPAGIFNDLRLLETLNLGNGGLSTLSPTVFNGLPSLTELNLRDNRLTSLSADIFNGLDNLVALDLTGNQFVANTGLPIGVFDPVLDTLGAIRTTPTPAPRFVIDGNVRAAYFVCSHPNVAEIVAATAGITDCLRINSAQFNTAALMVDATLSALTISNGILNPVFNLLTTGYAVTVTNDVTSVIVTPTAAQTAATITVNGAAVNNGSASDAISLPVRDTPVPVTIVVTAADTRTIRTYTVTVTRATSLVRRQQCPPPR